MVISVSYLLTGPFKNKTGSVYRVEGLSRNIARAEREKNKWLWLKLKLSYLKNNVALKSLTKKM